MSYTAATDSSLAVLLFLYMAFEAMVLLPKRADLDGTARSVRVARETTVWGRQARNRLSSSCAQSRGAHACALMRARARAGAGSLPPLSLSLTHTNGYTCTRARVLY